MEMEEDVVIVGAGVAGLATALSLKRVGVRALVLERSKELRVSGAALTMFPNAWLALDALGVAHKLTTIYAPYRKGSITNVANGTTQEVSLAGTEGKDWEKTGPRGVHRRVLLETLVEELPPNTIRYSSKLKSIEIHKHDEATSSSTSFTILRMDDGTTIRAKVVIGCDGVHSMVARWLGLKHPVHSGRFSIRGLVMYPEGHGFEHKIQQFVDKGRRVGIAPLTDKELYWFMAYQSDPKMDKMPAADPKLIQENVLKDLAAFPQVLLNIIRQTDLASLTLASLTFRYPWNLIFSKLSEGSVTVAGDSMHPMTPDLGQGVSSALEDAVVLGRHIGNSFLRNGRTVSQKDIQKSIEMYVKERRWRAALIISGSYVAGWVQQAGGSSRSGGELGWFMKFLRDTLYYKFLHRWILGFVQQYDCGKLPTSSSLFKDGNCHETTMKERKVD